MSTHSDDGMFDAAPSRASRAPSAQVAASETSSFMTKLKEVPLVDPPPKLRSGNTVVQNDLFVKHQQHAIEAQLRGHAAEAPCSRCEKGIGPFQECFIHPGALQCGNCLWDKKYKECSHHSK